MVAAARSAMETWLRNHAWAILASAFALYGGYVTGQTTTESRLAILENKVATGERSLNARRQFMVCSIRNLDQIQDQLDLHPPCNLELEE